MEYNKLGRSGLRVSELSFGSWLTFGDNHNTDSARKIMHQAFDAGVNFFDNAEVYAAGSSEKIMGEVLSEFRREDLVVSTKIFWGGDGPNDTGLSRKHLVEGTKNALHRMKLEYVDLLYCHRPDPDTPVEETVFTMDALIRQGLAFYWGTSEWPADRIQAAYQFAEKNSLIPPTMEQPQYNLFIRNRVEKEYASLYDSYQMGLTIWSPLASGMLTGKYNDGIPEGSRLAKLEWLREKLTPERVESVKALAGIAAELDCSLAQLAVAWCLKNPNVSTVILGATNEKQLSDNLGALAVKAKLNSDVVAQIEQATNGVSDL